MSATNRIFIDGDSSAWIDVDPANAEDGFQLAAEALLTTGGTLYVTPAESTSSPGTPATYRFNDRVVVRYPDTEIVLSKGAVLEAAPSTPGIFATTFSGFRLQGGTIRDSGATVERNLVRFVDTGSRADRGEVAETRFEIQVPAGTTGYHCIRATGRASNDVLRGLCVRRCTFLLGGAQSSAATAGGLPTGAICVRTRDCAHTQVLANRFFPLTRPQGFAGTLVVLENDAFSLVGDNTVEALNLQALDGSANPCFLLTTYGSHEGHHTHLMRNYVEATRCSSIFKLEGGAFDAVLGNTCGRCLCPDGAVLCTAVDSRPTTSVRIGGGNGFHNINGGSVIRLVDSQDVLVAENSFTLLNQDQVVVEIDASSQDIRVATEVMQFSGKSGVTGWVPIQGGPPVPA